MGIVSKRRIESHQVIDVGESWSSTAGSFVSSSSRLVTWLLTQVIIVSALPHRFRSEMTAFPAVYHQGKKCCFFPAKMLSIYLFLQVSLFLSFFSQDGRKRRWIGFWFGLVLALVLIAVLGIPAILKGILASKVGIFRISSVVFFLKKRFLRSWLGFEGFWDHLRVL